MTNRKWLNDMSQYDMLMLMNKNLLDKPDDFECIMDALIFSTDHKKCNYDCKKCIMEWLSATYK